MGRLPRRPGSGRIRSGGRLAALLHAEAPMDTLLPGLPIPVALATVAVFGYLFGRLQRPGPAPSSDATRRELKRAQAIVIDLEKIAQRVRRELALHHANLATFKRRVGELAK